MKKRCSDCGAHGSVPPVTRMFSRQIHAASTRGGHDRFRHWLGLSDPSRREIEPDRIFCRIRRRQWRVGPTTPNLAVNGKPLSGSAGGSQMQCRRLRRRPCFCINGISYFVQRKTPFRSVSASDRSYHRRMGLSLQLPTHFRASARYSFSSKAVHDQPRQITVLDGPPQSSSSLKSFKKSPQNSIMFSDGTELRSLA